MPYPTEHAARVKDPGLFESDSFRSKQLTGGIRIIIGKLKGESGTTTQAYRFSINQFTAEAAKKWLKDHNISFIKFEAAKNESEIKHVGVLGMKWGKRKARVADSSDHTSFSTIKKKKLKNMTDEELNTVLKRARLVKEYRSTHLARGGKQIRKMSNEELVTETKRGSAKMTLLKSDIFVAFKKFKELNKMNESELNKFINRLSLEKQYKDIEEADLESVRKLVDILYFGKGKNI